MDPSKYGLRPTKSLGQNFITDRNVLERIVDGAGICEDDMVVEIGPGLGVLTAELAAKAAEAEVKGDMDALADIQKQHTTALIKEKEKEWKASRPQLNAGSGAGAGMTMDEIQAIPDTEARVKAIAQNIDLYNKR